jgi:prophage regulatory protein
MADEIKNPTRLISRKMVSDRTRLPCSSLYERINPQNPRHDPTFPRPVRLGERAVGWVEAEVEAWLIAQIQKSRGVQA